mmetsp:Transcript_6167/g.16022  ORF Transcript_6167/g.16022 Transcript_6167/m.16022 type:complete len:473 (+) Transcript_6167:362-1780(+)
MRRAARTRDDHLQTAIARRARVLHHALRRSVRAYDGHLVRNAKLLQSLARRAHRRQVGVASHDDANDGRAAVVLFVRLIQPHDVAPDVADVFTHNRDVPKLALVLRLRLAVPVHGRAVDARARLHHAKCLIHAVFAVVLPKHVQHPRGTNLQRDVLLRERPAKENANLSLELAHVAPFDAVVPAVVRPWGNLVVQHSLAILEEEHLDAKHAADVSATLVRRAQRVDDILRKLACILQSLARDALRRRDCGVTDGVDVSRLDDGEVKGIVVAVECHHDSELLGKVAPLLGVQLAVVSAEAFDRRVGVVAGVHDGISAPVVRELSTLEHERKSERVHGQVEGCLVDDGHELRRPDSLLSHVSLLLELVLQQPDDSAGWLHVDALLLERLQRVGGDVLDFHRHDVAPFRERQNSLLVRKVSVDLFRPRERRGALRRRGVEALDVHAHGRRRLREHLPELSTTEHADSGLIRRLSV